MTTVTESDIKELKDLIKAQGVEITAHRIELSNEIKTLDVKFDAKFEALDRRMTENFSNLEKRITDNFSNLEKRLSENFSNLDKRITTQEFIYRSVFLAIIGIIATNLIRYFWDNPIIH